MGAVLRFFEVEFGASAHDLALVVDVVLQHLLQVEDLRLAVHQRQHDRAEGVLQLRVLEQVVEHHVDDIGHGVAGEGGPGVARAP